jgi:hypothetical protein
MAAVEGGTEDAIVLLEEEGGGRVGVAAADGQGGFQIQGLPDGRYTLRMIQADKRPFEARVEVFGGQVRSSDVDLANIVMQEANVLEVTVMGEENKIVPRCNVSVMSLSTMKFVDQNITDEEGKVRFLGLPEGHYLVDALYNSEESFQTTSDRVSVNTQGETPLTLQLRGATR